MNEPIMVTDASMPFYIKLINEAPSVVIDIETNKTGNPSLHQRYILGIGVYIISTDTGYYFPLNHVDDFGTANITDLDTLRQLKPKHVVMHGGKFDKLVMQYCLELLFECPFTDTMLKAYIWDENETHALKDLGDLFGIPQAKDQQTLLASLEKAFTWEKIPGYLMAKYCLTDCVLTHKVDQILDYKLGFANV